MKFMVVTNWAGYVFVKEQEFFREQGGFRQDWGKSWREVEADSIEDARRKGCEMLPGARSYAEQAK